MELDLRTLKIEFRAYDLHPEGSGKNWIDFHGFSYIFIDFRSGEALEVELEALEVELEALEVEILKY